MSLIKDKVKSDPSRYECILKDKKIARPNAISLQDGGASKRDWKTANVKLIYDDGSEGYIDIEKSKRLDSKYRFIAFLKSFDEESIFRFDSDGATHDNKKVYSFLNDRFITTPHFHQYDDQGKMYAFKTELLDHQPDDIKNNINLGVEELCKVYSIFTEENCSFSVLTQPPLFTSAPLIDPNKEIPFDNE